MPLHVDRDCVCVELGAGDLIVAHGFPPESPEAAHLVFIQSDQVGVIGTPIPELEGKTSGEIGPSVHLRFSCVQDLDRLAIDLRQLRAEMLRNAVA